MKLEVSITAIPGIPNIKPGDDLARIFGDCLVASGHTPLENDILCIAHKVFSKAEGNIIHLAGITPSPEAVTLASELNKDPRKVEVILQQSNRVVRSWKRPDQPEGTMICEHKLGFIAANAGVDASNTDTDDTVITLPDNPDASADNLRQSLEKRFGCHLGVVITDTFGRPWRLGQVNFAIGLSAVPATQSEIGKQDGWGRSLSVTEPAFADEIAAASGLLMQKANKTPLVLFRGLTWHRNTQSSASHILRNFEENMFR